MDILSRFVKFVKGLRACPSVEVAVMCGVVERDIRSVTGSNLEFLRWEIGMDPLGNALGKVKEVLGRRRQPYLLRRSGVLGTLENCFKLGERLFMREGKQVR